MDGVIIRSRWLVAFLVIMLSLLGLYSVGSCQQYFKKASEINKAMLDKKHDSVKELYFLQREKAWYEFSGFLTMAFGVLSILTALLFIPLIVLLPADDEKRRCCE